MHGRLESSSGTKYPAIRPGKHLPTIPDLIETSCRVYADRAALQMRRSEQGQDTWVRHTYAQLLDAIQRLAAALNDLGLKKGQRVAVLGENRPEWPIAYLGTTWAGGIVVPLDPRLTEQEHRHILRDADAKFLIASGRMLEAAAQATNELDIEIISMDERESGASLGKLCRTATPRTQPASIEPIDRAVVLYTSGTTGLAKGVVLSHRNIMSNVDSVYRCYDFGPGDNFFSVLPLHHVFEATAGFLTPLYAGSTITYARSLKPNELREDMVETEPTVLLAVPLLLEKVLQGIHRELRRSSVFKRALVGTLKGTAAALDVVLRGRAHSSLLKIVRRRAGFASLRYIISGGAALPAWISRGLSAYGFPIFQGYGLSETSPVLAVNPPNAPKNDSVGPPIPGVEIKIVDAEESGVGEIAASGPNVMAGYYRDENATRAVLTEDGWLLTGDLGFIDEDGYIYITGRKKSVIVTSGGKNVYPEEVETALVQSPLIEEVLVLAGPNPRSGEDEVQAMVFPNYEALDAHFAGKGVERPSEQDVYEAMSAEIKTYASALADYKRPRRFTVREEEFPKTTTRKIKRYLFEKPPVVVE